VIHLINVSFVYFPGFPAVPGRAVASSCLKP
jgi:hypothetical protein